MIKKVKIIKKVKKKKMIRINLKMKEMIMEMILFLI
jgi:hypothetical protein